MRIKLLEIRDKATFIPALVVDMNEPADEGKRYLLRRCGYPLDGYPNVLLTRLRADGSPATNDSYWWQDRTWRVAHEYIIEHWAELHDGSVVDVEYALGERAEPKRSERFGT